MNDGIRSASTRSESLYSQPVANAPVNAAAVETAACQGCGTRVAHPVFELPGTPYRIVRCAECGLGSLYPMPSAAEIATFYPSSYYGGEGRKFTGLVERLVRLVGSRQARFLSRKLPPGGRVLDVGCGRGVTLQALADAGFETHGYEVGAAAVIGLDPRIRPHLADSLGEARLAGEWFDAVIVWHVLEHVPAPRELLEEVHRLLRPGGVLVVAVPNWSSWQARWMGAAWFHLDPPRHLYQFPLPVLRRLIQETGFHAGGEHHFSLRQNPFGWIQSALNLIPGLPRNGLYEILHHRPCVRGVGEAIPRLTRWVLQGMFALLAVPALVLSISAAGCRRGATVHVVATKR